MIIIPQGKRVIVNFDRIAVIYIKGNAIEYQCPDIEDFIGVLGIYKTETRANQVLGELYDFIAMKDYEKIVPTETGIALTLLRRQSVFEMPQE